MAHIQKPDFVFRRNGRVHLNRRGHQFSRLLAAEVWASAFIVGSNAGYTMFRGSVKGYWLPNPFASVHFTSPPVRRRVPSHFNWSLPLHSCCFRDLESRCLILRPKTSFHETLYCRFYSAYSKKCWRSALNQTMTTSLRILSDILFTVPNHIIIPLFSLSNRKC